MLTRFSPAPQDVPAQAGVGMPSLRKRGLAQRGTQKLNFIWGRNWDEAWLFRLYPEQQNKIKPSGDFAAKPGMLWPLAGCTSALSPWAHFALGGVPVPLTKLPGGERWILQLLHIFAMRCKTNKQPKQNNPSSSGKLQGGSSAFWVFHPRPPGASLLCLGA